MSDGRSDDGGEDVSVPSANVDEDVDTAIDQSTSEQRFREVLDLLRQHGTDDPEQVLAQLNQYYLSVPQPDSEYEGLVRAAERMDSVDPGSGKRFIQSVIEDYERQSRLQEREQAYQESAQSTRHWHASIALGVAAFIALGAVGGGIYCAVTGNTAGAAILLGGTVAVIIAAFLKVRITN